MTNQVTELTVEDIYQKKEQKEHVLELPDTYIGSIDLHEDYMWIIDEDFGHLKNEQDEESQASVESTTSQLSNASQQSNESQKSFMGDILNKVGNANTGGQTRMIMRQLQYVPGLYKIYDEVLVNAMDHWTRMNELIRKQKLIKEGEMEETPEVTLKMKFKPVKNIKVDIDQENNIISIMNDGDGIPVVMHKTYEVYVPELIFSQFLTSGNYQGKGKNAEQLNQIKIIGGKNGFGAKLTAAYSKSFTIETVDANRKKKYIQTYRNNLDEIDQPIITDDAGAPYTKITFEPDLERFGLPNLTNDMTALFKKRVYDMAGWCTGVNVFYNDFRIPIRDFNQYTNLYLGPKNNGRKRVFCKVGDRWEICATVSEDNEFQQVSMVNGVLTRNGGRHVDHVANKISNKLAKQISTDKNPISTKVIKSNLWLFVRAVIENPSFDSQTKENMTTKVEKFGSKCEISDDDVAKIGKCGVSQRSKDFSKFKEVQTSKSSDGKKTSKVYMDKLEDAANAGSKKYSQDCTLILTEGDSAKEFAIDGLNALTADQRKFWGAFPLKGKPLNVRDAQQRQVDRNDEIVALKKILALRAGEDYSGENIAKLRYGRVMILSDSDVDGDHIKGLVINLFHKFWPSLLERDNFICTMITPIVKVWKEKKQGRKTVRHNEIKFYSENEYYDWKEENNNGVGWKARYYKGLGTSDDKESEDAFREMKVIQYKMDPEVRNDTGGIIRPTDQAMDLAFLKKNADLRKEWLLRADLDQTVDYNVTEERYSKFINKRLIQFSWADTHRSIPNLCDGLKPSQRKVMYYILRHKFRESMKVSQLGGAVSKDTAYHHGEVSLEGTIVGLAQNFVGAHNINYLVPEGKFGSRYSKGKNAASSRYIFTKPEWLLQHLYKKEDNPLYKYLSDDGFPIEPEWYLPVIPTVLVNGANGIGTGFSTFIPQHNPLEIVKRVKMLLNGRALPKTDMVPWYRGFGGKITKTSDGTGYLCIGDYTIYTNSVRVKELPIDGCFEDYKRFLESLEKPPEDDKKVSFLSDLVKSIVTDSTLCQAEINFKPGGLQKVLALGVEKFERELKLRSKIPVTNMTLFNHKLEIKKYSNTNKIITDYYKVRLDYYDKRKKLLIAENEYHLKKISAKYRFVTEIIEEKIDIKRKPKKEIERILEENEYPKFTSIFKLKNDDVKAGELRDDSEPVEDSSEDGESYQYLLSMQIYSFSQEMLEKLRKDEEDHTQKLEAVKQQTPEEMWLIDLEEFETEYIAWIKDWYTEKKIAAPKMVKSTIRKAPRLNLSRKPTSENSEISENDLKELVV